MSTVLQTPKGFRDFLPDTALKRQFVLEKIKKVFTLFGFDPLETPAIEFAETLKGKYGDEEKLIYEFTDRGGRTLALRYDQTVPLSRVIAQYPTLPKPFKRYQIQNVWRAENTQKGRFREFLQCDADIVGTYSNFADAEVLAVVYEIYKALGLDILIKINDRNLLKGISPDALVVLDKLYKIGEEGVISELVAKGLTQNEAQKLLADAKALKASAQLREIESLYYDMGYPKDSLKFENTLVRGLNYYTGLILEVVLKSNPNSSSLCGGGRYDNLIGIFSSGQVPAVGFAIGFDRTIEALDEQGLLPTLTTSAKVLVTIFNADLASQSQKIAQELRSKGINTELYLDPNAKLEKQLKYADAKGIPYAVIIGPQELGDQTVNLKNLTTKEQSTIARSSLAEELS